MITEQHYDEEVLIALLDEGDDSLDRDPHIVACRPCSEMLASVREIAAGLKSVDVWDTKELSPKPSPKVLETLRAAQSGMQAEDAAADEYVRQLLAGPRETWSAKLAEHPEWRTAGTVRKLIAATDRAIETMPPDAVEITALALDIAEGLGVARLCAHAWRERGYALYFTGSYADAREACAKAEQTLEQIDDPSVEFDRARLAVVSALIEREREEYSAGIAHAKAAATTFASFGQTGKFVAARRTEGLVYYGARQHNDALRVYKSLLSHSAELAAQDRAALLQNIATCYTEMGEHAQARHYYGKAMIDFDKLHMITARAKSKWSLAKTLMAESRYRDALNELLAVRGDFEELGMSNDFAMTSLDIAETYVMLDQPSDARSICSGLMAYFKSAGITQTAGALMAVSYLHEAFSSGRATPATVSYVRDYFEDLSTKPALLFVPPD